MDKLYIDPPQKHAILRSMAARYPYRTFIETGTGEGETTEAMIPVFDEIISIEIGPDLYMKTTGMFLLEPKVKLIHGVSDLVLPFILDILRRPAIFWLDAHYCGKHRGHEETPVREELEHIFYYTRAQPHVVLIDDARCFTEGNPERNEHYPTIGWIKDFLQRQRLPCPYDLELADDMIKLLPRI